MTPELEQLRCIVLHAPVWDGDLISKEHTEILRKNGYVERAHGYTVLTANGIKAALDFGFIDEKERSIRAYMGGKK